MEAFVHKADKKQEGFLFLSHRLNADFSKYWVIVSWGQQSNCGGLNYITRYSSEASSSWGYIEFDHTSYENPPEGRDLFSTRNTPEWLGMWQNIISGGCFWLQFQIWACSTCRAHAGDVLALRNDVHSPPFFSRLDLGEQHESVARPQEVSQRCGLGYWFCVCVQWCVCKSGPPSDKNGETFSGSQRIYTLKCLIIKSKHPSSFF